MKIGDPIWFFDINKRTYARDEKGRPTGGPIWREHWRAYEVIDETRVSWVIGTDGKWRNVVAKLPKKAFVDGACPSGWATSQEQIDRLEWIEVHRIRVCDAVRACEDYEALQRAAAAVGYAPPPTAASPRPPRTP